jgi:hypothetical protein
MTFEEFWPVYSVLAIQLHATDADEPTAKAMFAGMQDLEPELVAEAAKRLGRAVNADGESWFPKLGEWRVAAVKVEREWQEQQRQLLRRLPAPLCPRCHDTQWKRMSTGKVRRCECAELRRLELLGRQPLPKQLMGQPA